MIDSFLRRQLLHVISPDQDLSFPDGRIAFIRSLLRWHRAASSHDRIAADRPEHFTMILQSYKRPWNIEPMARLFLRFQHVERVIVSNNNPDAPLRLSIDDPRLHLINQPRRYPASLFTVLALREAENPSNLLRASSTQYFLCIDDDLLLFPDQIAALMQALINDPSVPHGLVGQRVSKEKGWMHHLTGDTDIDILNRAYAFTADHVHRYMHLLDQLGYQSDEEKAQLPFGSDIVLSRSGSGKPRIHDVGSLLNCPTNAKPGIARFKEKNFQMFREELWEKLNR